jgi:hypothetical protein
MMFRKEKVSPRAFEELSAYIDGQVSQEEAQAIEAKLARSIHLQQAHDQIKALRAVTRALPQRKAPRNFILTRAEAAAVKRGRNWSRAFGLAFSLCAVFLVVLLGYDGLSNGLFAMKAEAPQMSMAEDMTQDYSMRDASESADESAPEFAPESAPESVPESPAEMIEEPVEEKALEEETVLLTWGAPSAMTAEGGGAMDATTAGAPTVSPYQLDSAMALSPTQVRTTRNEPVKIHLDPITGKVTICDPEHGCGYGGSIQSGSHPETKNEFLVDPELIYYDQKAGMLKLCPELGACPTADETLIVVQAVRPGEEPEEYSTAFPLILGMDHENEGELLSVSPQIDEGTLEAAIVLEETKLKDAPAGPYDDDSDHQNYLRDQRVLWLKIGLVGLTILFGIIWLIIRRR